ncbi:prephenate dehydrogenase [Corynebacterium felinum]|uniref:Prephenate dehydrogenase n=1 Tax=Corynebacterium felinum TaxID=131318 RepID=A0ABU2B745_9CORY|nr:prephenate dehydrogenase [Corynebacterium felinum]MDF5820370.1 prephenate dehydrogenase [Corynebacterium felinum]MDR7354442.1 prephenate dehydrogenase [Corynebacterium felinum]WJY93811.1 prephenate dehydrogenase [Corynebacterium felinum]
MTINEISRPVCVLGLGLIGGSLLRALKERNVPAYGFNRSPSATRAASAEGYDVSSDLEHTLHRAEADNALIVLATPMPAIGALLESLDTHAPSCGFTDVVSVKGEVYDLVRARGMHDRYVGGHPMAGTANSGWDASYPTLFERAVWVVTFDHALDTDEPVSDAWIKLWIDVVHMATAVGAEVIPARVHQHDAAVARVSHLPHILAEALAIVGDNGGALSLSLAAGSFRDGTRVAGSAPSLVRAMCETNHAALLDALDECLSLLHDARAHLAEPSPSLEELIDNGYRSRIRFEARSGLNAAQSVSPTKISNRPVFRLNPGAENWINQLIQAENLGARIEVF